jgi:hypothetical protein
MLRKKTPAHPGWVLIDVVCCTAIVMIVVTCVAQAADMMSGIALKNWNMRANAADYLSLSDEMSVRVTFTNDIDFTYGKWRGRKLKSGFLSGLAFADVAIGNKSAGEKETVGRLWDIPGRR